MPFPAAARLVVVPGRTGKNDAGKNGYSRRGSAMETPPGSTRTLSDFFDAIEQYPAIRIWSTVGMRNESCSL